MNAVRGSLSVFRRIKLPKAGKLHQCVGGAQGQCYCEQGVERRTLASAGCLRYFVAAVGPRQWWE